MVVSSFMQESLVSSIRKGVHFVGFWLAIITAIVQYGSLIGSTKVPDSVSIPAVEETHGSQESASSRIPTFPREINQVALVDRNHWFVTTSVEVWKTEDAGMSWSLSYPENKSTGRRLEIAAFSAVDSSTAIAIIHATGFRPRLLRTIDGETWEEIGSISSASGERILVNNCHFSDRLHGWLVGISRGTNQKVSENQGIILATRDGGRTWVRQFAALPKTYFLSKSRWGINDIYFRDTRTGWAAGDAGVILSTEDGGDTWVLGISKRVDYQRIDFLDSEFGWATYKYGNGPWGIALTSSMGRRWSLLDESFLRDISPVHAVFVTPKHGFAVNRDLYETRDGGRVWKLRYKQKTGAFLYLGRARDGTLVALGVERGGITTLVSTDGGALWQFNSP